MLKKLLPFPIILIAVVYACDFNPSPSIISEPEDSLVLTQVPYPSESNRHLLQDYVQQSDYSMNYSTLAHTELEHAYTYRTYEMEFPEHIVKEADGKTRIIKYSFTIPTEYARPNAARTDNGDVILRVVNKLIPDTDEAARMVYEATSIFEPGGNLHQILEKDPRFDLTGLENESIRFSTVMGALRE